MSIDIEEVIKPLKSFIKSLDKLNLIKKGTAYIAICEAIKALEQQQEEIKARDEVIEYLLKYYPYNSTVERLLKRVYKLKQWNKSRDKSPNEGESVRIANLVFDLGIASFQSGKYMQIDGQEFLATYWKECTENELLKLKGDKDG